MTDRLSLKASGWDIEIAPEHGAGIVWCKYKARDIFRPSTGFPTSSFDPTQMAHFPLVPFSNRIAPTQFAFNGQHYNVSANFVDQPFALHGEGWLLPWQVKARSETACKLSLNYQPAAGNWPFPFLAEHDISIRDSILTLALKVTNTGDRPCPAGLGLHPYFPNARDASLTFTANHIWDADPQILPLTRQACTGGIDFSCGRAVRDTALDNVFSGWQGKAQIRWKGRPDAVTITSAAAQNLVVYTPEGQDFFCVEPVTHINNAIHIAAEDTPDGMKTLSPGQSLSLNVSFSVT